VTFEEVVQPVVRLRRVVIERRGQIHRTADTGRIATVIPGDVADTRQAGGELGRVGGTGEPAVEILAGMVQAAR
jgi:hypothetical protein